MFHISFDVEDEHLGEVLKYFSITRKVFNIKHDYLKNAVVLDSKVIAAYHNANELVIKYILKKNIKNITTREIGSILKSAGYAPTSKGAICFDLVKAGMLVRTTRGNYTVNLSNSLLGGPLFSKENEDEKINRNEAI